MTPPTKASEKPIAQARTSFREVSRACEWKTHHAGLPSCQYHGHICEVYDTAAILGMSDRNVGGYSDALYFVFICSVMFYYTM